MLRRLSRASLLLLFLAAPAAAAAGGGEPSQAGVILFGLAVLITAAKFGGIAAQSLGQPPVLGELLVGISVGNLPLLPGYGIAFVKGEPTLTFLAEMGVLILLFEVGLEADLRALVRVGWSSFLVALIGIITPLGLGWAAAAWLLPGTPTLAHIFVGATLAATSVGITARVLKDLGATNTKEAQIILGAAVLDDVLGLIVLAIVSGAVTAAEGGTTGLSTGAIVGILFRAVLFLGVTVGLGRFLSGPIVRLAARTRERGMLLVFGLALCFILAFLAEQIGLAAIVGAFAAGLMLDPYGVGVRAGEHEPPLIELMEPLRSLFVPLFFVLMGVQVDLGSMANLSTIGLGLILTLCAIISKQVCALGVLEGRLNRLAVGIGMVPRGEVGLIFAGIGVSLTLQGQPLLTQGIFSAIVFMILVTTLITPLGLRWAFHRTSRP